MWGYYFGLALRSGRRSKALTALVVLLMGFGVAACMVTYAVFRATAGDPIPAKSSRLFSPQLDNFGPANNHDGLPLDQLSYTDAVALLASHQARRTTLDYPVTLAVMPDGNRSPFPEPGDAVTSDFFAMFDVPFQYGGGWGSDADERRAAVAVISHALNRKLFGGANSVGRTIKLGGHDYRVAGVLGDYDPLPRFFNIASTWNGFGKLGQIYIPFARAVEVQQPPITDYCSATSATASAGSWDSYLHGECVWINGWVELPTAADVARYRQYLHDYAAEQQHIGRFTWPPNVRLRDVMQMLADHHAVPAASKLSALVSLGFLLVCLVNVVGLLLARFARRTLEIGVRRALGAPRHAIYRQCLIEAAAIGLAGGALGLLLTAAGMAGIGLVFEPNIAKLARMDGTLMLLTVLVAVSATLLAALYPTYRAAQVQPAWQLKANA